MTETVQWTPPPSAGMTSEQAYGLATLIRTAWPNGKMTEQGISQVWLPRLMRCDAAVARAAIEALIGTEEFAPSVAKFLEVYRPLAKRAVEAERSSRAALPQAQCPPEKAAEWRAKLRETVAGASGPLAEDLGRVVGRRSVPRKHRRAVEES